MRSLALALLLCCVTNWSQAALVTFDDFTPSFVDGFQNLSTANGGSSLYQGVVWDAKFVVVGDQYRIDTATPGPAFGVPHSGDYFVTNGDDGPNAADNLTITTNQILTGSWWGQNEYYGYGGGATDIAITAFSSTQDLLTLPFHLPEPTPAGPGQLMQPTPLAFFDTSAFSALTGIAGYRISRTTSDPVHPDSTNWIADDFTFVAATTSVPEPSSFALLALAAAAGVRVQRRRRSIEKA